MADERLDTQVRREQIAEAALGLVASQGLRRLSVAAVARRVGLVPSGIYRHFKSKDEIMAAVLDLLDRRIQGFIAAAQQESSDPLAQLRGVLVRHVRFIREGRAIPRIVFSDDVHSGDPKRKQRVLEILKRYLGQVAAIVRRGQEEGSIRRDVEAESVGLMFLGVVVPAGVLWHLTDGDFDVTRHAERCWRLVSDAILPHEQ